MKSSSPAPSAALRAQGLAHGLTLRIDAPVGGTLESFITRVEDVTDAAIAVLIPMRRLQRRPLPAEVRLRAYYVFRNKRCHFLTEVSGANPDGSLQLLRLPDEIESSERRGRFRLETVIEPRTLQRILVAADGTEEVDEAPLTGTLVDLSEGGLCLRSPHEILPGEILRIEVDLPAAGEISARMRVLTIEEPPEGYTFRRLHCEFAGIGRLERDRIGKFLIRRQLEMRKAGQL